MDNHLKKQNTCLSILGINFGLTKNYPNDVDDIYLFVGYFPLILSHPPLVKLATNQKIHANLLKLKQLTEDAQRFSICDCCLCIQPAISIINLMTYLPRKQALSAYWFVLTITGEIILSELVNTALVPIFKVTWPYDDQAISATKISCKSSTSKISRKSSSPSWATCYPNMMNIFLVSMFYPFLQSCGSTKMASSASAILSQG